MTPLTPLIKSLGNNNSLFLAPRDHAGPGQTPDPGGGAWGRVRGQPVGHKEKPRESEGLREHFLGWSLGAQMPSPVARWGITVEPHPPDFWPKWLWLIRFHIIFPAVDLVTLVATVLWRDFLHTYWQKWKQPVYFSSQWLAKRSLSISGEMKCRQLSTVNFWIPLVFLQVSLTPLSGNATAWPWIKLVCLPAKARDKSVICIA